MFILDDQDDSLSNGTDIKFDACEEEDDLDDGKSYSLSKEDESHSFSDQNQEDKKE